MTYLVPPVVIAMAWALLGEVPPLLAIGLGAACIAGVIVARMPARPRVVPSPSGTLSPP